MNIAKCRSRLQHLREPRPLLVSVLLLALYGVVIRLDLEPDARPGVPRDATLVHQRGLDVETVDTEHGESQQETHREVIVVWLHLLFKVVYCRVGTL